MAALLEDKMNIRMSRLEKAISEKNATATVKAVEEVCVTCGSNHNFNNCPLTRNDFPVFQDNIHQFQQTAAIGNFVQRNPPNLANQMRPPGFNQPNVQNNQVPEKLKDPGKFLIPCALQELNRTNALANSGASINLLPHSIYKKLGLEAFTPTRMTLELANRSITHPMGIAEDVVQREPPLRGTIKGCRDKVSSSSFTLTSPEESELEAYLEKDSIPPGIDLTLPPTLEVSSSHPNCPTPSREVVHGKCQKLKKSIVSRQIPIDTIVMPIRITFDNPIDFNDNFSKPKDFKKDLTISLDSSESSILPPPLLDSDSPFTAELSASITLNSLRNEDKVFNPGILVYHTIHDKNLVTLEKNLRENISSGTLLFLKEPSSPRPPSEPPDVCMRFKPILAMKNDFVKPNEDFYLSETVLSLNVEDVDSFTFIIWTFLPYFTYPEDSPLIFSFRSENFVFGWHVQWKFLVLSVAFPKDNLI
ncbi:reverse transcriptase domain-containing protein [Tanacetum coccineum]